MLLLHEFACWPQAINVPPLQGPALQGPKLKNLPNPDRLQGRMQLQVVVTDKSGKPVTGMERKDFALLDDKMQAMIVSRSTSRSLTFARTMATTISRNPG
jgi:hypothetical protein